MLKINNKEQNMILRKNKTATDLLQEKQNEVARLSREANAAVDLVTRTMDNLGGINQQIDNAVSEIDDYTKELTATRNAMVKQRCANAAIIANFAKLLDVSSGTVS